MNNSPVWTAATIAAVISAAITLLVAFGVQVTPDQVTAILGFVAVVAPIGVAVVANPKVTSLSRPIDEDGVTPLVRADGALPRAQARSMGRQ